MREGYPPTITAPYGDCIAAHSRALKEWSLPFDKLKTIGRLKGSWGERLGVWMLKGHRVGGASHNKLRANADQL
jgi:hypothetical protein